MSYKQRDIALSFASRWQRDWKYVQSVIEVSSKPVLHDHPPEILIRCRHDPHIDSSGLRTPESFEFPLLKHTQQLGLKFNRQFDNFVEKERTSISGLKASHSWSNCASECSSLMPEKFSL